MESGSLTGHFARIGDFLRELYASEDVGSLYGAICGGLGKLVAGDNIFIGEHDMVNTQITGCVASRMFETPDFISIVNASAGQHPLWEPIRTGGQVVRCLSDHATTTGWENTMLFKEALGKEGVRDHISIEFGDRRRQIVSVGVFRDGRGFADRDRETMAFLIPHIEQALENARRLEAVSFAAGFALVDEQRCVVNLDTEGNPLDVSDEARRLLARFFPEQLAGRGDRLPSVLSSWAMHCRNLFSRGALEQVPRPFRLVRGEATFEARLFRMRNAGGYSLHLLGKATGSEASPGLTLREEEVLRWVRQGKRNEEIAVILGIGKTTIKTHLKHIYQKLGVDNRTAAARFF